MGRIATWLDTKARNALRRTGFPYRLARFLRDEWGRRRWPHRGGNGSVVPPAAPPAAPPVPIVPGADRPVVTRSRIYVLFALPKSGSQAIAAALDVALRKRPLGAHWPKLMDFPAGLHVLLPLHARIAEAYPAGGWLHTHAPATFPTLHVLKETGSHALISMRHPLDQLAAYFCHVRKHAHMAVAVPGHPQWIYGVPMAPHDRELLSASGDVDAAIGHLIRDGYLFAVLAWMADWLRFRAPQASTVVRYKDVIANRKATFAWIAEQLGAPGALSEQALADIDASFERYRQRSLASSRPTDYPRGWTGGVGIWEAYVNAANLDAYCRVVEQFLSAYPGAAAVADLYPDLIPRGRRSAHRARPSLAGRPPKT